jgi:hypothetical protein
MLCFTTPGSIDIRAIQTFGLSSKDSSHIGRFGTGLKYAAAIVLRLGGTIEIETPEGPYKLGTLPELFRGKPVSRVTLNGETLAFTTDLGRDWEPWMAYREFYANTLDEGGTVELELNGFTRQPHTTQIRINCAALTAVHFERETFFIPNEETPIYSSPNLEIYAGSSKSIFYRGIAIHQPQKSTRFRYNLLGHIALTEDRTASSSYNLNYIIAREMAAVTDPKIITTALSMKDGESYEANLDYPSYPAPSPAFVGAVYALGSDAPGQALLHVERHRMENASETEILAEGVDTAALQRALSMMRLMNIDISKLRFGYVRSAGLTSSYQSRSDGLVMLNPDLCTTPEDCFKAALAGYMDIMGLDSLIQMLHDQAAALLNK